MKLRAITLENVRRFTDPVRIGEIGDGLNVLCEPNEQGKSTLFDAIRALFFKPHGSRDKEMTSLRPHSGGAPVVTVEIETEDGRFTLAKRWFSKPSATVHQGSRLIAQADVAEAWIADLLGADAGAPSGLIWVRQGLTDLTGGTPGEEKAALEARRDLMSSVGEEVEAMTGGRRMDMALSRCRSELDAYATGKNRTPKKGGPWKAAQDRVADLTARRDGLAATAADLHEALAERKRARRGLRDLEAPEAAESRHQRLEEARAAHRAAERHAEEVAAAARKAEMARLSVTNARSRLDALRAALSEQAEAAGLVQAAETEANDARAAQEALHEEHAQAERTLEAARERLKQAEETKRRADRVQAARDGARRRKDLEQRIADAERARAEMERAAAAARTGPDAAALREIEALAARRATAVAARDATATQVIARYAKGREGTIRVGDDPLAGGVAHPLPRATRLSIEGVGELEIRPAEAAHDDHSVEAAETALQNALGKIGVETVEAARQAAESRMAEERRHGEAQAVYRNLAPDGIDPLREALARIPQAQDDADDAPDPDTAEDALTQARDAHDKARIARDRTAERLSNAKIVAARAETSLASLHDRQKRADEALSRLGDATEDGIAADLAKATEAQENAEAVHAEKARNAPDLDGAAAALKRAESVEQHARDEVARLRPLLARLDERIARSSGEAVEERLAETEQELEAARHDLARIEHEVAVLTRLEEALETARTEARERYFEPVARELKPLLGLLWPEAELTWGQDTLLPDALVRDGQKEPIDILSGGTQEQVALLVRLAFARMLAATGRVAPVILDDALVFTDDDRIERMFDALHRQAADLQIIVLTCRQRVFRELGGNALRLSSPETAGTAAC